MGTVASHHVGTTVVHCGSIHVRVHVLSGEHMLLINQNMSLSPLYAVKMKCHSSSAATSAELCHC